MKKSKKLTSKEAAEQELQRLRGSNMELWIDGEQTEYWKEIFELGFNFAEKQNKKRELVLPPQRVNGKLIKGLTKTELKNLKNKTK